MLLGRGSHFLGSCDCWRLAGGRCHGVDEVLKKMRKEENESFLYFFKHVEILLNGWKFEGNFSVVWKKFHLRSLVTLVISIPNVSPTVDFV